MSKNVHKRTKGTMALLHPNSKLTASVMLHIPTSEFKHARFVNSILGITHLWQDSHAHYLGRSQCQTSFPQSQQLTLYDVKEYKNNHRFPSSQMNVDGTLNYWRNTSDKNITLSRHSGAHLSTGETKAGRSPLQSQSGLQSQTMNQNLITEYIKSTFIS